MTARVHGDPGGFYETHGIFRGLSCTEHTVVGGQSVEWRLAHARVRCEIPVDDDIGRSGAGWKITYRIPVPDTRGAAVTSVMTVQTALDGKDAPNLVDGKPSGQSMQIRKIDDRHTITIVKVDGKQSGISKSELSADGKTITTENDYSVSGPNGSASKQIQHWDKQ